MFGFVLDASIEKERDKMEIMTQEKTRDLKPYKFNEEIFGNLPKNKYESLKEDIKKKGVKVELHILPDKTVICGHQRLKIAKELKIEHLRCKTVYGLDTPEQIREYVIVDNLFRWQFDTKRWYLLLDELSRIYEKGRGFKGEHKEDGTFKPKEATVAPTGEDDVLEATANCYCEQND
jgi:ParB-like chromosome segregation protein Spo0J